WDVGGNFSYKVYDIAGRLRYDVSADDADGLHEVTEYVRDAFGNVTRLIQYANGVNFGSHAPGVPLTIADVQAMLAAQGAAAHAADRVIATSYDALDRAVLLVQPQVFNYDPTAAAGSQSFTANPVTRNVYDAFNQVVQVQTLDNPLTNTWINTTTS